MSLVSQLIGASFDPLKARHLGNEIDLSLSAAGNNSQANALQLTKSFSFVSTVTTVLNSVKLPVCQSWPRAEMYVRNDDFLDVLYLFPAVGDALNALATDTAIRIFPKTAAMCYRVGNNQWFVEILDGPYLDISATLNPVTFGAPFTYAIASISRARVKFSNKQIDVYLNFLGTASATTGGINVTLPCIAPAWNQRQICSIQDGGNTIVGMATLLANSGNLVIQVINGAAWAGGANSGANDAFSFEVV